MSAKKVLLAQFDLHNLLFNNVLDGITDSEAENTVAAPMNNVKWLSGHLLRVQGHLAGMGGVDVAIPWSEHFPDSPAPVKSVEGGPGALPSISAIKAKWNEVHPQIRHGLENLPDEALAQPVPTQHPIMPFDNSLGGLWAFVNHHQAYTIGQLGILRRGLNKDAMKYN